MKRAPDTVRKFGYAPEAGVNPGVGFTSFQHFRGEKLYADIVVRPEANMTETERVECYPVSADAEEICRGEGWYPDGAVVYIRFLWKEFEPEQGVYNYAFVREILDKARAHGQGLILRLMAHSTRACDDVPEWLKEIIPCPVRPDGRRVKDSPTAPEFMELFLRAVKALGERFDEDPVLEAIDISLPGAWGEGHKLELYPDDIFERIMDTYAAAFPHTQLMAQMGRPELIEYAWNKHGVRVGWRGDGLGDPNHTENIYPPRIARITEAWKHAPVSFESYWWLGEWQRRGWEIDEIIEKTLEWHISTFNGKSMPAPPEWREKIEKWISRMGYHFAVESFAFPANAAPGDETALRLTINNVGVAPIYRALPLKVRICGQVFDTDIDISRWLPGVSSEEINITLPEVMPRGEHAVEIGIPGVYLCTDAPMKDGFYTLGRIII